MNYILALFIPLYFVLGGQSVSHRYNQHPNHSSITEIAYKAKNKSFEVAHKIFIDDIEDAIFFKYGQKIKLSSGKADAATIKYLTQYLDENFIISNGKKTYQQAEWVGMELTKDYSAIWVYRLYPKVKKWKSLKISNSILFDTYGDQENFTHFNYDGYKKSHAQRLDNKEMSITLNEK